MAWVTIAEFCKKKGIKHPEVVYNKIATGKLEKDKDWREVEVLVTRKQIFYEE